MAMYMYTIANIIEVSLSEPPTTGTALQDTCVCLSEAIYRKFKLNKWVQRFQICTRAKVLSPESSHDGPHYVTPHQWIY